jgi:hypothetical protein
MQVGKFETLTRAGFAARGIMYMLIGYLALKTGRSAGSGGALEYLASGAGKFLLAAMALGFLGYGIWRLSEALLDTEGNGADGKGIALRAAGFLSGLIHLGLAFYAAQLAFGAGGGEGSSSGAEQGAATALSLPGGEALLLAAGAVLLLTGVFQIVKAAKLSFLRHLDKRAANEAWVQWSGRLGYAARGLVFVAAAYFLWRAGSRNSSAEAADTGDALMSFPETLQMMIAAGLFLFGLFSLVEARYRRINDPQVLERLGARSSLR